MLRICNLRAKNMGRGRSGGTSKKSTPMAFLGWSRNYGLIPMLIHIVKLPIAIVRYRIETFTVLQSCECNLIHNGMCREHLKFMRNGLGLGLGRMACYSVCVFEVRVYHKVCIFNDVHLSCALTASVRGKTLFLGNWLHGVRSGPSRRAPNLTAGRFRAQHFLIYATNWRRFSDSEFIIFNSLHLHFWITDSHNRRCP